MSPTPIQMSIRQASGPERRASAFTVARWSSADHELQEIDLVASEGGQMHLLYQAMSPTHSLWRSDAGVIHLALLCELHRFVPRGGRWDHEVAPMPGVWGSLSGVGEDLVFALGLDSAIVWDGAMWSKLATPGSFTAVHGVSRDRMMAVGLHGAFARWEAGEWQARDPVCNETLVAVHAAADDDVWAIDAKGTLYGGSVDGLRPVYASGKKLLGVARFGGKTWVAVEGSGLFLYADEALTLVKDTFHPTRLEARAELVCTSPQMVVGSADGLAFKGVALKSVAALLDPTPPLWAKNP